MALARLDCPAVILYNGTIAPGRCNGRDVTILDVFEAIGAHAAGKMSDEELHELEGGGLPRRRGLRRAVHRQHDGDALRVPRALARRARRCPSRRRAEGQASPRAIGELVMRVLAEDLRPSQVSPASRSKTRSPAPAPRAAPPTSSCTCSPSPTRPGSSSRSTTSSGSRAPPRSRRPQARRALRRHRSVPRRRRSAGYSRGSKELGVLHGDAITVSGRTIGEEAAAAVETRWSGGGPAGL